jgi:uncharacterized protein (TIGR02246 family)
MNITLVVAALVLSCSVANAQVVARLDNSGTPGSVELLAVRSAFIDALNSRDAARVGSLYAADAIMLLGDGRMLRGTDEIRAHFEEASASGADEGTLTLTPARFDSSGEVRSETGTSVETSVAGAGAVTGAYVVVYTRQGDGHWRIAMDLRTNGRQPPLVRW